MLPKPAPRRKPAASRTALPKGKGVEIINVE